MWCSFVAHILPGVLLILLAEYGRSATISVILMSVSLGFNGAATVTNLQNSQDLAPNYAGSLYGIMNFIGTTSGFFSPMIVAHFTKESVSFCLKSILNKINLIGFLFLMTLSYLQ